MNIEEIKEQVKGLLAREEELRVNERIALREILIGLKNPSLTMNDYQRKAMTTCTESSNNFAYMALNLVGEVGEFMSKVAKAIRKERVYIGVNDVLGWENELCYLNGTRADENIAFETELKKELGDILWQLSGVCSDMGWDLNDIAQMNLDKLAARKKAGTIVGNGDGITDRTK